MTCPYCHSKRITYPTTKRGKLELKSGPASCDDCGATQTPSRNRWTVGTTEEQKVGWRRGDK